MRPVHVAETDEKARAEAEPRILEADSLGSRGIAQTVSASEEIRIPPPAVTSPGVLPSSGIPTIGG